MKKRLVFCIALSSLFYRFFYPCWLYFGSILAPIFVRISVNKGSCSREGHQEGPGCDFDSILGLFWPLSGGLGGLYVALWGLSGRHLELFFVPRGTSEASFWASGSPLRVIFMFLMQNRIILLVFVIFAGLQNRKQKLKVSQI